MKYNKSAKLFMSELDKSGSKTQPNTEVKYVFKNQS